MVNSETMIELTRGEFENFTKQGLVFINFFAECSMSCMMMDPIIEDLMVEFNGLIKIGNINIEENSQLAQKFKISSTPHFILMSDGKILEEIKGEFTQEEFGEIIKKYL